MLSPCLQNGARLALFRNNHCFCILQLLKGCAIKKTDELDEKGTCFGWKNTFFGWENLLIDVENHVFFVEKHIFQDEHVHSLQENSAD